MKTMWISYGRRDGIVPPLAERWTLPLAHAERWYGPIAVAVLFAYPNPLVPLALTALGASLALRVLGRRGVAPSTPLDAGFALFTLGALLGLGVAHNREAALLRFTGLLAGVALFYLVASQPRDLVIRRWPTVVLGLVAAGIFVVLGLLRGQLPDSALTRALGPFLRPFEVFPGITGDTLDVNARFAVHQYGLAHLLLVGGVFAGAAAAFGPDRRAQAGGFAVLVGVVPLLLATQARGAIVALAIAVSAVAALRTRRAWAILPVAGALFYGLLARGTISRSIEAEWLGQRLSYWTRTLGLLGDFPFSGSGLGTRTFAEVFAWYHGLPDPYVVSHTHNIYLQAYAEQGLLGLVGLLTLVVVGVAIGFRAAARTVGPARWAVAGAAGALLASAVYGLTDQVPSTNLSLALVFALLAIVAAADGPHPLAHSPALSPTPDPGARGGEELPARIPPPRIGERPRHVGKSEARFLLRVSRPKTIAHVLRGWGSAPGSGLGGGVFFRQGASGRRAESSPLVDRRWLLAAGVALLLSVAAVGLAPRWVSGALLNRGSAELVAAALDRSGDVVTRLGRLERAEWALAEATRWNRDNVAAWRNLGWARLLRNDIPGAHEVLARPPRAEITPFERGQLARLASEAGLIELAVGLLKDGGDEARLREVADQMWAARRWRDAAFAYAALAELDPDEAEYVSNTAIAVLNGGGDAEEAMRLLGVAVAKNPGAARNLARQLVLRGEPCRSDERRGGGRFECAQFWFGLASRVDPTYDRPEVELGSITYYRGLYEDAARHFLEALRRDPRNASTYTQLGDTHLRLGRHGEAVVFYEQAVRARPERADLHVNLARAYLSGGWRAEALQTYRAALALAPNDAAIHEELRRLEDGG